MLQAGARSDGGGYSHAIWVLLCLWTGVTSKEVKSIQIGLAQLQLLAQMESGGRERVIYRDGGVGKVLF